VTQWSDLAGSEGEIHTYQRNRNSGSQELMEKLVMRGEDMIDSPDMILESMMGPINAIKDDPLGIGYSVYFYAKYIFPDENVKMLAIDSVVPDSVTIAGGSYPLATEVHAVIREGMLQDHAAVQLRNWLLTAEGQEAIAGSGYVPIHRPINPS
jgi:phosphate transport system substrate-binding protein